MKKILAIIIVFGVFLFMANSTQAIMGASYPSKEQVVKMIDEYLSTPKEKQVFRCPISKMSNQDKCFNCHTMPNFKIKESFKDEGLEYPNRETRIKFEGDKKIGHFFLTNISSYSVKEAFDYFDKHDINHIVIEIHSPGGSIAEAWRIVGIMQAAERKGKTIETRVYGYAASAGFLIFVSGTMDHRFTSDTAELMWHELMVFKMFDLSTPSDKKDEADVLRHLQDTGNEWLASRSKLTKEEIDELVAKKEYWINGKQAIEFGFADGLI